jgi:hypothetical protein
MTPSEIELLNDLKGFIDVAIRNGLSFGVVVGTLGHDVNGLARYGFDLDKANADSFLPKVTGSARITQESVGEPDAADE